MLFKRFSELYEPLAPQEAAIDKMDGSQAGVQKQAFPRLQGDSTGTARVGDRVGGIGSGVFKSSDPH